VENDKKRERASEREGRSKVMMDDLLTFKKTPPPKTLSSPNKQTIKIHTH